MPPAAASARCAARSGCPMAYLIGIIMTLYPYAAAAASLATDDARNRFAVLSQIFRYNGPGFVLAKTTKRTGKRR